MGVDAKLFIRPEVTAKQVIEALENVLGYKNVKFRPTHTPEYVTLNFKSKIYSHNRSPNFFYGVKDDYFGMACNLISMGADEESEKILETLATIFGGVLQRQDTTDDAEIFRMPGAGNLRWLVDQYFIHTGAEDVEPDQFLVWVKEFERSFKK